MSSPYRVFILLIYIMFNCNICNASDPPPNIIFILVDVFIVFGSIIDEIFNIIGWATVGYHDNEVQTPFIDDLRANESLTLLRHYVYKYCSPTRSSFLSGRLPIHVNQQNRGIDEPG
eukprot:301749_1